MATFDIDDATVKQLAVALTTAAVHEPAILAGLIEADLTDADDARTMVRFFVIGCRQLLWHIARLSGQPIDAFLVQMGLHAASEGATDG